MCSLVIDNHVTASVWSACCIRFFIIHNDFKYLFGFGKTLLASSVIVGQEWGTILFWWCSLIWNISLFKRMHDPGRLWTSPVHLSISVGTGLLQVITSDRESRQSNMAGTILHCLRFPKQVSRCCFVLDIIWKTIFSQYFPRKTWTRKFTQH